VYLHKPKGHLTMRLTRVRISVRRMMILVAVVACLLSGVIWCTRMRNLSAVYRHRAIDYGKSEETYRQLAEGEIDGAGWYTGTDGTHIENEIPGETVAARTARLVKLRSYYSGLNLKYLHAAARPWMPVSDDPPDPETPFVAPVLSADGYGIWRRDDPNEPPVRVAWSALVGVEGVKREETDRHNKTTVHTVLELTNDRYDVVTLYDHWPGFGLVVEQMTKHLQGLAPDWYERLQVETIGTPFPISIWRKPEPEETE